MGTFVLIVIQSTVSLNLPLRIEEFESSSLFAFCALVVELSNKSRTPLTLRLSVDLTETSLELWLRPINEYSSVCASFMIFMIRGVGINTLAGVLAGLSIVRPITRPSDGGFFFFDLVAFFTDLFSGVGSFLPLLSGMSSPNRSLYPFNDVSESSITSTGESSRAPDASTSDDDAGSESSAANFLFFLSLTRSNTRRGYVTRQTDIFLGRVLLNNESRGGQVRIRAKLQSRIGGRNSDHSSWIGTLERTGHRKQITQVKTAVCGVLVCGFKFRSR